MGRRPGRGAVAYSPAPAASAASTNSDSTPLWPTNRLKTPDIACLIEPTTPPRDEAEENETTNHRADDAARRYGEQVSSAPTSRGRLGEFVRWVVRTPWPVFALGMLQADIIGALLVLGFLRFGLPPADRLKLLDLPKENLAIFLAYLFVSTPPGPSSVCGCWPRSSDGSDATRC